MARKTELTQEIVNETAEEIHSKGVKPSPNNVREVLGIGSYSTIKKMLDIWKEKQEADENIFIPDTPDFAYRIVDRLHKELYLQNRKQLDNERQQLEVSRQEVEKSEMLLEINSLEESNKSLKGELTKKIDKLTKLNTDLNFSQGKIENLLSESNEQKIKIATLTERDKQQSLQLKEKEVMLKQTEEEGQFLVKKIEAGKTEINQVRVSLEKLNGELAKKNDELSKRVGELDKKELELTKFRTDTEKSQENLENLIEKFNDQKNDLSILTEREKQHFVLTKQIEELMKKLEK